MKVTLELLDGRRFECEANEKTINCLADRFAFEQRFRRSAAVLNQWRELFDESGQPKKDADVSGVSELQSLFMLWREVRRRVEEIPDWDEFVEQALDVTIDAGDDGEDPTETDGGTDSPATES